MSSHNNPQVPGPRGARRAWSTILELYLLAGQPVSAQELADRAARWDHCIPGLEPVPTPIRSDAYLRFLVRELKPFIDRTYRTRDGAGDTFAMAPAWEA